MSQYNNYKGSRYNEAETVKDVVKIVRKEIKQMFPDQKFSVRLDRSGYSSKITVEARKLSFNPFTVAYMRYRSEGDFSRAFSDWTKQVYLDGGKHADKYQELKDSTVEKNSFRASFHSKQWIEMKKEIQALLDSFQHDRSDVMTDYFDYRFYDSILIDYDLEAEFIK